MDEKELMAGLGDAQNDSDKKEKMILECVVNLADDHNFGGILSLVTNIKKMWTDVTTARLTKIVKKTLHLLPSNSFEEILHLMSDLVAWAERENKKLLRLDLECKKINALLRIGRYSECLGDIKNVLRELKKFDDKENQIRLYICESRAYYELRDMAKARSSLTSARILAVSSYCPMDLQAQIDLISGMLICDEHHYSTAYSYFLEAIDSFNLAKEPEGALVCARYLLLSKIIDKRWSEIASLTNSKLFSLFINDEFVILLLKIKECCKNRDLRIYQLLLDENGEMMDRDTFIRAHLYFLYGLLFESNILKIIEPYSNIKIDKIAALLKFSNYNVEEKVRKMILDRSINGIIDHVNSSVLIFDKVDEASGGEDHLDQVKILKEFVSSM